MGGRVVVGTSGWVYGPWRGVFYPVGLAQRGELGFLAGRVSSVEVNGSFYALQRPESYRRWWGETPEGFVFSVKGPRFITHMKRLRDVGTPVANFFASGVLALGAKLGPVLWQLPQNFKYEPDVLAAFFDGLPRTTTEAVAIARGHDERMAGREWLQTDAERPVRHAIEVRNPDFATTEFVGLLRDKGIALVVADTAGKWPFLEDVTADFVYVRLHGDKELYASGYTDEALDLWAAKIRTWRAGKNVASAKANPAPDLKQGRDVFVYFDNDMKVKAPADAQALAARL
ncbi:DUF72 domain-containing protein [Actinokineospora globicatena]|uniref:DUF72 domain-containing protein n=1 Tax=Actinokineospora globicatena TaxID=103729 RepID=UPI0020A54C37|nr:DUF72 domain-containing protein [Actinokineospora globicatena]MCP2302670.1 Uncharacterized conserved protein YecE, DUF72 family [Actinokineospora globicatena]GLW75643.1 hypothetical protein Aglo01_01250 [Actinokineospora globicatena]GLW82483.1 hypothetical protein Aglo02_01240 [Actinokineospora globicatena]